MIENNDLPLPILTIAIPTYNRARLLDVTLQSVLSQHVEGVEVVVLSNASADGTDEMMADYCARYDFIRYVTSECNRGIDANIHRCSLESRGEYVHMLSDDDVLLPGALNKIIQTIQHYPEAGFIFLNMQSFKGEFGTGHFKSPIFNVDEDLVFHDKNRFVERINIFATLISCFIFKRELWNSVDNRERYIGTDIYLSYVLYDLLCLTDEMILVAKPSVAIREEYTGSYRIFYAFAEQWGNLLLKRAPQIGYESVPLKKLFHRTIIFYLVERIYSVRTKAISCSLTLKDVTILFLSTHRFIGAWVFLYPSLILPVPWHKKYFKFCNSIATKLGANEKVASSLGKNLDDMH